MRKLQWGTLLIGLVAVVACDDGPKESEPRFRLTSEGDGESAQDILLPLRPGYIAIEPMFERDVLTGPLEPSFAMVTRTTNVEGGNGVVLTVGPTEKMHQVRFDYVLDETSDGVVVRSAGGQVFDPPWLLIPRSPRDGMTWEIDDGEGHLLGSGSISRAEPTEYPRTREGEMPAIAEVVTPWIVSFDVARGEPGSPEALSLGFYAIEDWEKPIRRDASGSPASPQFHYRAWNPLMPNGRALTWTLIEGEGFVALSSLVPANTIETRVEPAQILAPVGDLARVHNNFNVGNVSVTRNNPNNTELDELGFWGTQIAFVEPENFFVTTEIAQTCFGLPDGASIDPSTTWTSDGIVGDCTDATHFEIDQTGASAKAASAPTWFGYTHFERLFPVPNPLAPDAPAKFGDPLVGAFTGLYQAADGTARGLAHSVNTPQITHDARLLANDEREPFTDRDFPAESNIYRYIREIDEIASKVANPVLGEVLRTIALRAEGTEPPNRGIPTIVDSYPVLGHAILERDLPEGARASAYLPDFQVDAWLPDALTVSYEGAGRRAVYVAEAYGSIRELDIQNGELRWRSLGRPAVPDRHVVVGAYRRGDFLVVFTQKDASYEGNFEGVPSYTLSGVHAWHMAVQQGEWEALPTHLYPGVDKLASDMGWSLDRAVCAPDGVTIERETIAFEGRRTRAIETSEQCSLVLRDEFNTDIASLLERPAAALTREIATLTFTRSDLGDVRVRGREGFVPIGGRHVVPRSDWELLRRDELFTLPGTHYESLAAPFPTNDAFPGNPGVIEDNSDQGTWVLRYESLQSCPQVGEEPTPCFEIQFADVSGETFSFTVPANYQKIDPDDEPLPGTFPFEPSGLVYPADDHGIFVMPRYWVSDSGVQDIGELCAVPTPYGNFDIHSFATTSPQGRRPPFVTQKNGTCADAAGNIAPRIGFNYNIFSRAPIAPMNYEVLPYLRDVRIGVHRSLAIDELDAALLETFGGPLSTQQKLIGLPVVTDIDYVRRRALVLHPHEQGSPWLLYETDALLRPVALIAAGVVPYIERGESDPAYLATTVRPLDLPFLPHRLIRSREHSCDPDTERLASNGTCECAYEHERIDGNCVPIFGGSYFPAPSCAAIARVRGAAPEWAYIDPDGTTGFDDPMQTSSTTLMRCREDGLTELAPEPVTALAPAGYDTAVVGAFELQFEVTSSAPGVWIGLFEAPLLGGGLGSYERVEWAENPIAALAGDQLDRLDVPQKLLFRIRSEERDLGTVVPGTYRFARDAANILRVYRDGVELASGEFDVSPLYISTFGIVGVQELLFATRGALCLPQERDYGAGLCELMSQSCEERGHECGIGDDGAFGRIECGECSPGFSCEFARCVCRPDDFEPNDGLGYWQAWKLGVDEATGTWSRTQPGLTLDSVADVDKIEVQGGDRAYMNANEFIVTLEGAPGVSYRLEAGLPTGCATSCAAGTATSMEPYIPPTRPPGCVAQGTGTLNVRFRVQCDLATVDAERGPYIVHVSSSDPDRDECVPYDLSTEIVAAASFP